MSSNYWRDQFHYYINNSPPATESYYNKSFVDKISETKNNIDNLVAEKDKSWARTAQKQDEYNTFYGSMSSYGDVYSNAENEFGVKEAQDTYEKSKQALALAESTLSALPSSINSSSNRVLTQQQRENKYNILANKTTIHKTNLETRNSMYENVWKQARKNQSDYAAAEIVGQYKKLGEYNNAFVKSIDEYSSVGEKLTQANMARTDWENGYRKWQHRQHERALSIWVDKMNSAFERYRQAMRTELVLQQSQNSIDYAKK